MSNKKLIATLGVLAATVLTAPAVASPGTQVGSEGVKLPTKVESPNVTLPALDGSSKEAGYVR
jgi:hypothetical protein